MIERCNREELVNICKVYRTFLNNYFCLVACCKRVFNEGGTCRYGKAPAPAELLNSALRMGYTTDKNKLRPRR